MSETSLDKTADSAVQPKPTKNETPKTEQQIESLIYVGPSLGGGKLTRFTVYQGGKPKYLEQLFIDCPEIERLFVPVDKLTVALEQIGMTGTPYNTWFNQVIEFQKKGAGK